MLLDMNATIIPFPARRAAAPRFQQRSPSCWATPVHELIDQIEPLFDVGDFAGVIELCRQALNHLSDSCPDIDDLTPLGGLVGRLDDLHLRACAKARPDPLELAEWLFAMAVDGELDGFVGAADRYAEVLGSTGLAQYERLLASRRSLPRSELGRSIDEFRLRPTAAAVARARHPSAV